jgi:hypothetical protein
MARRNLASGLPSLRPAIGAAWLLLSAYPAGKRVFYVHYGLAKLGQSSSELIEDPSIQYKHQINAVRKK